MATNSGRSSTPTNQTRNSGENNLKNTVKYNYRVQSAPPLSIQHFLRYSTGVIAGAKQWQHSGKYRQPRFNSYLSPEVRQNKKPVEPVWHPPGKYQEKPPTSLSPEKIVQKRPIEPVWHPPGKYQEKPPTSLSPEKIVQKRPPEPVWHPAGKFEHKPVPFFDPPSLRWSLQDLLRSMPEMRPKTFRASRSMSTFRKSQDVQDT
jgi:hypothetical protein